jgi:anthranilate phosphoribosyltransferase
MFAPVHHPAMKAVAPVRREMGVRTIFNILGPLTNPANAPNILMGVFHPDLVGIQVRVLQELGAQRALVVWGRDGMDELSLGAATLVGELRDGVVREYEVHPEDFGIAMAASRNLRVNDATESKAMLLGAMGQHTGPAAGDRRVQRRRGAVCRRYRLFDRRWHRACARCDRFGRRAREAGPVHRHHA